MGPRARAVCSLFILLWVLPAPAENSDFYLAGDYLLGGLFSLHANVKGIVHLNFLQVPQCKEYEMKVLGYNLLQAMRFAVEEINNQSSLLPGVLLGYEMVDVCYISNNIQPVLYFLAREDYSLPIQEDYSHYVPRVVAVIGPDNSESATIVAHFLSLFLLPQITYSAISDDLRDKNRFPSLLRTVPGADHQVEAMVQLMLYFRWNWIILLVSSDDYGRYNGQLLNARLATRDICIAFQETLPLPQPNQEVTQWERQRLEAIVDKIQQSSARVVVLFSPDLALHNFFREVLRQNFTGAVWIASESWAIDLVLHNLTELRNTGTFLGITAQSVPIPGFSEFRTRPPQAGPPASTRTSLGATCNQECDSCQDTTASFSTILTLSGERVVYSVYSAVYAVAHALHSLLRCTRTTCSKRVVYPWEIPVSMCSKDCQPGQRKKPIGIHPCCFECLDCLPGTFLNRTADEYDCQSCPSYEWSHRNDTSCFKRRLAFLEWHEASTIIVAMLSFLGFLSTLAIVVVFWRHLHTPMVRSAGGPMCFLMLVPLLLAYAMVPTYVGRPTFFTCLCRQTFFTLCFTICISCITVRSFQIVCIFKMARRLPRAYGYWVRYHGPYVFVASFTALKVVITMGNVLAMSANPTARPDPDDPKIMVLSCNYRKALLFNTGLDLLLSVAGFSFAYMGKELPTNYNEAKFITFCMTFYFTSSISLCTFMSVYEGVLVTILDLLFTVLNLLGISLGYFGPKCYMVLFYPERNTQVYFSSMIQGYTMGKD
uniref:Taste receptor type 1 member 2 n=1 Tax=Neovison vison TaxID=452646 RepID=A0A8C7B837_NEOVI